MVKKITLSLALLASISGVTHAQRLMGVSTGNYVPTKSLYLNPALINNSRLSWSLDLFSINTYLDQNYGTINSTNLRKEFKDWNFQGLQMGDVVKRDGSKTVFDLQGPVVDFNFLNAYVNINEKHSLALTMRARLMNQLRNYDSYLFSSFFNVNNMAGTDITFKARDLNQNFNGWSEIGLTYATQIWGNEKNSLSLGLSARYLTGLGYIGTNARALDGTYYDGKDSIYANDVNMTLSTNAIDNTSTIYQLQNGKVKDIFNSFVDGKSAGFGADIGFVYEWRPNAPTYEMDGNPKRIDPTQNAYKLRVSAAVTDIGGIKYKEGNSYNITGSGSINTDSFGDRLGNVNDLRDYLLRRGFATSALNKEEIKISMPTALTLGIDYNIAKNFYANLTYIGGLTKPDPANYSPYTFSQVSLVPRFENKMFTFAVPMTYNMTSQSFKAGVGVRIFPIYIGTDDILALAGSNSAKGANFYFGAQIPIAKKKRKDTDGDLVSNKLDKCEFEKGVWEYRGCPPPDKDKDGIVDSLDKCPDIAGVSTAQGCPDADLDGVPDGEDLCPNEAGSVVTKGCPDRDGDGIADKDDACPDIAGLAQFKGCLDTDGDGIGDADDKCPQAAGPVANQGCPDTDNDGVPDHLDRCPTVPGTKANQGCPEIRAEVKKRLAFAATAIQFETGKAVIKKTSHKLLDEIVSILNEYKDYNMTIDGHTDDVGSDESNLKLSKDRAAAVKDYFVSKGIADSRLSTNGYGESQPKASNKTAAGRAKNRRVDMDLKLAD